MKIKIIGVNSNKEFAYLICCKKNYKDTKKEKRKNLKVYVKKYI